MKEKRIVLLLILTAIMMLVPSLAFADEGVNPPTVVQTQKNDTKATVTIPGIQNLIAAGTVDSVKVEAGMTCNDETVQAKSFTKDASAFGSGSTGFEIDLQNYGKWNVDVILMKGEQEVSRTSKTVPVIADIYNITSMRATMPVLILTLKAVNGALPDGPLIMTVVRTQSLDWDALPEGMYANPLWDGQPFGDEDPATKEYIRMLYEISPDSHFYFYFNDYHINRDFVNLLWIDNPIPEDNYSVRFITDGNGSYSLYKQIYGTVEDASARHQEMIQEVTAAKAKSLAEGKGAVNFNELNYGRLPNYVYAIVDGVERDAEWWVIRKSTSDTFVTADEEFAAKFAADDRVKSNYINNLLAKLSEEDSKGTPEDFKKLFKFDDEQFEATRARGKKIMMILGTSKGGEAKAPIEDYVRITQAAYGDAYEYYYKGHPGYIPELNPGRREQLEAMGLQILDSSIAAELFLFYDPDVQLSGYQSTTFVSSVGQQGGLYNISKQEASELPYADNITFFVTDLRGKNDVDKVVRWAVKYPAHHNYLVELKDTSRRDFAIYDADLDKLYFVKASTVTDPNSIVRRGDMVTFEGNTYMVSSGKYKTVTFVKAQNQKKATVPASILIRGETYKVIGVAANAFTASKIRTIIIGKNVTGLDPYAFKKSKATRIIVKTTKLTKQTVTRSLKGSKVSTIKVKVGRKAANQSYVKQYKKIFKKKNSGKKVKVKR